MIVRYLILLAVFLLIAGCTSTNSDKKTLFVDYKAWMDKRCGRCHSSKEFHDLMQITKSIQREEFGEMLQGMVHGDIKLTDAEITEALDYFEKQNLLLTANY